MSPLEYYAEGPLKEELASRVARTPIENDPYPFGRVMQDLPGSAQGCWFTDGVPFPPEDEHLALVQWNRFPELEILSIGRTVASLDPGIYPFEPEEDGQLNRHFADLSADGTIYGYEVGPIMTPAGFEGVILLQLADAYTIWLEGFTGDLPPEDWAFTDNKTVFVR